MGSRWALMRSGVIKSTDKNDHGVAHMKVTPYRGPIRLLAAVYAVHMGPYRHWKLNA